MKFTLTKSKPFARALLVIAILFVIVALVTILNITRDQSSQGSYRPTSISQRQPIKLTQPVGFGNELAKLQPLPLRENGFSIDYQAEVNILSVKITTTSKEEYRSIKTRVENYIKAKGVENACSLNIFWVPEIEDTQIRKSLETQDYYASGCQPPTR